MVPFQIPILKQQLLIQRLLWSFFPTLVQNGASLVAQEVKKKASAWNVGDPGSIPGLERSLGEGNSRPLQYSCLENPMDKGAW